MGIVVYNRKNEIHEGPDNYMISRPGILGNPYSELDEKKTRAIYRVESREEAIEKYDGYYDMMYGSNVEYTKVIDEIYEKYKSGKTVYLECFCKPLPCHGDVIKRKLEQRLLREEIKKIRG